MKQEDYNHVMRMIDLAWQQQTGRPFEMTPLEHELWLAYIQQYNPSLQDAWLICGRKITIFGHDTTH